MEQKKKKLQIDATKKWILLIDGLLLVGLIAAVIVLITTLGGRGKAAASVQSAPATQQETTAEPSQPDALQANASLTVPTSAYATALQTSSGGVPERVDFESLRAQGVEATAFLYCPNTAISYPVMHTLDNEYYMDRNELGKRDPLGAISLDCRNSDTLAESQIMLYGNAMEDGSMFGSLANYSDAAYLSAHPCMYLCTPEKTYRIDIFAANLASPAMANYPTWFETDAARATYLNEIAGKSFITSDVAIAANAQLVSLVTNSDFESGEDSRFVVHGVLVEA